ncbi:LysR family transcriptional regulator [Paraburkholderia strydomiana]|nr:LysR family transcriptional regulator [Paraburkholderia strydomiana]
MKRTQIPIDLRALQAFVTVCESGSMTSAAKRLGVSQSAVSQLVGALERDLDVEFFDRGSRPLRLTIAGRTLFELSGPLLEHAQTVGNRLGNALASGTPAVRLGCVDSFAATIGPELIRALSGTASQLAMWSGLTPGLLAQMHEREVDVVVCTQTMLDESRIVEVPLFSEAFVAVAPRRWMQRHEGHSAGWKELAADLPLIRYTARSVIGQQVDRFARHLQIDSPRRYEFDATDPLLSLVSADLGFAISTPLCLWQARQYLEDIVVLPLPPGRLSRRDFFLLHREGEWEKLAGEIVNLTRRVIESIIRPSLRRALPALAEDALQ